ncbi:hypothetical protein E1281_09320 [Actinomadura sp. KC345]|uniref:hypothetical protein n=1 Tax=Actinomadura sp. KC345 TaxID=2530371 RepID=UPI001048AAEE|nr:hypothetical protein [Actinomadura sp. KC345]TDC56014.1 hypothetical protein E1281_09320 [Actinomadura sp. KC345]
MITTPPHSVSYADLDRLTPEVLPARLLLSALAPQGGGDGTTITYACQATYSHGTTGLLGTGLLAQPAYSTMTCIPGTVVTHH